MNDLVRFLGALAADLLRGRAALVAENALLRQQLIVAERKLVGRLRWAPWQRFTMGLAAWLAPACRPSRAPTVTNRTRSLTNTNCRSGVARCKSISRIPMRPASPSPGRVHFGSTPRREPCSVGRDAFPIPRASGARPPARAERRRAYDPRAGRDALLACGEPSIDEEGRSRDQRRRR
jgi:hypothetical protein